MGRFDRRETDGVTQIFFQNVNGISAANDFVAASEIGLSSDTNRGHTAWRISTGASKTRHDCDDLRYPDVAVTMSYHLFSSTTRRGSHNGRRKLGWPAERPREDSTASDVGQHALSAVKTTPN
jgi:hypothetical protein